MYGSETWALRMDHMEKLHRTEMSMVRWMCGVSLKDQRRSEELLKSIGVKPVVDVVRSKRMGWYGRTRKSG